jgi:hypothetical protein
VFRYLFHSFCTDFFGRWNSLFWTHVSRAASRGSFPVSVYSFFCTPTVTQKNGGTRLEQYLFIFQPKKVTLDREFGSKRTKWILEVVPFKICWRYWLFFSSSLNQVRPFWIFKQFPPKNEALLTLIKIKLKLLQRSYLKRTK